jgi:hypothetical protein
MKRPDLIILIAIWEFISAFLSLVAIAAIVVFVFPQTPFGYNARIGMLFGLTLAILILAGYCGLSIAAGIGLLRWKEWGRITAIVHAALSCFSIPFGTVIGVLSLIYLTKANVRDYFTPVTSMPPKA